MSDPVHNSQFTIHNSQLQNPNLRSTAIFVHALAQSGLRHVVISPGSRSTPLTLVFATHPDVTVTLHRDERGAGFMALGMALALDTPVALVCTSGTAVANYLPAIVEAKMSQVPLLVLTGDRPHELRHSGANQTIDQVKIFGDQVLWSVDMPLPESDPPAVALRNVAATAVRAYTTTNGLTKGPVHVNFPFRKPLEPREPLTVSQQPTVAYGLPLTDYRLRISRGQLLPTATQLDKLTNTLSTATRGIIVCGPRCPDGDFPAAVAALAQRLNWPLFADSLSGMRFGDFQRGDAQNAAEKSPESGKFADDLIISGYETFLQRTPDWDEPQVVLRFGQVPTSKWLNAYLDAIRPAQRIHIRANGIWADDSQRTTYFLQANETAVCRQLTARLPQRPPSPWTAQIQAADATCWQAIDAASANTSFDGAVVADLLAALPEEANLFVGNSLPVRHVDQYGRAQSKNIHVYANRGASGIDGNIATGLGIAAASGRPTVIVVGDVTTLHDLNSLRVAGSEWRVSPATRHLPPATIVVLNNNGGGIFRRLPISQHEPPFTDLFLTPHGLTFEHAAAMFGLAYRRIEGTKGFVEALETAVTATEPHLVEVITDGAQDEAIRQEINQIVNGEL